MAWKKVSSKEVTQIYNFLRRADGRLILDEKTSLIPEEFPRDYKSAKVSVEWNKKELKFFIQLKINTSSSKLLYYAYFI